MRIAIAISCLCAALGCGASAQPRTTARAARDASDATRELAALREARDEDRARIRELEGMLALAQAEARDLRADRDREPVAGIRETVRIGSDAAPPPDDLDAPMDVDVWDEPGAPPVAAREPDEAPRPVLRLYGTPAAPLPSDFGAPPLPSPGASAHYGPAPSPSGRLPVVPLPGEDDVGEPSEVPAATPRAVSAAFDAPRGRARPAAPAGPDVAVEQYRAALAMVRDRRFAPALDALDTFLREHPRHPYADNAIYWRGEVHYAQRDYGRARSEFETVVDRYPDGNRVADSLLKIGMCHLRMGEAARARQYFEQVRRRFPQSVAARLASQEDPS